MACCAHSTIELISCSDVPMPKTHDPKNNALRAKDRRMPFYDADCVLSSYYKAHSIQQCIDILNFARSVKKKFGKALSTEHILGTKRYLACKATAKADRPLIAFFDELKPETEQNDQHWLNHDDCSYFKQEPLHLPMLPVMQDMILDDQEFRKQIELFSERKDCGFASIASSSDSNFVAIMSFSEEKGYFLLSDVSSVVPAQIMSGDEDEKEYARLVDATSMQGQCLVRIKPFRMCLIRQRRCSLSVLSPSRRKKFNLGGNALVLLFHARHCQIIKLLPPTSGRATQQVCGKKRSLRCMMELEPSHITPPPTQFVGLILEKEWKWMGSSAAVDRLFVLHSDLQRVIVADIACNSDLSTFLLKGMRVKFIDLAPNGQTADGLAWFQAKPSFDCQILRFDDIKNERLSSRLLPFATLYATPFASALFRGEILRLSHCKIVEILPLKLVLKCFHCGDVLSKCVRFCPNCSTNQIVGIYCALEMVVDDGTAQCLLTMDVHDAHYMLKLSKVQHVRLIHRLKDIGSLCITREHSVKVIDELGSGGIWTHLSSELGIAENALCNGFAYIVPTTKRQKTLGFKDRKALNEWMKTMQVSCSTLSSGFGYRKQSVQVLRQPRMTLKCVVVSPFERDFESAIDLLLQQMEKTNI